MPPSFMARSSRSSSGLVTDGPNHHHRIRMRESAGGFLKPACNEARSGVWADAVAVADNSAHSRQDIERNAKAPPASSWTRKSRRIPLIRIWLAKQIRFFEDAEECKMF